MSLRSVLIVEDDADAREILQVMLELNGMKVSAAGTAREGIALARQSKPCVILLDLMLPDVDGETFRRQQLRDPQVSDIPVIVVSAHPDARAIAKDMDADCVRKPVDFKVLLSRVEIACRSTR